MIGLDAADLIASLATGCYVVRRRRAGSYDQAGRWQDGPLDQITIRAAVYQASGRDLQRLPEGRRSVETKTVFASVRLYVGAQAGTGSEARYAADRLVIEGREYEVEEVQDYPGVPGYYRALVQAVE